MRVLCALVQLQDNTLTDVAMNLVAWQKHFATRPNGLDIDIVRFSQYPFERNLNEIFRYAIEKEYDYVFQYDADMLGDERIIERLVAHDKEVVGCLFFSRKAPHVPQLWNVVADEQGEIKSYLMCSDPKGIAKGVELKQLVKTDVRAGGFTLTKVSVLKELSYPYAEFKPIKDVPFMVHGIDMDVCWKITKKYGGVWTDFNPENKVRHITFHQVSENDFRL